MIIKNWLLKLWNILVFIILKLSLLLDFFLLVILREKSFLIPKLRLIEVFLIFTLWSKLIFMYLKLILFKSLSIHALLKLLLILFDKIFLRKKGFFVLKVRPIEVFLIFTLWSKLIYITLVLVFFVWTWRRRNLWIRLFHIWRVVILNNILIVAIFN